MTHYARVRRLLRQRSTYTGPLSIYDDPPSRAEPGGRDGRATRKHDWDALLAPGEHVDVPVPENLTWESWRDQIKRNANLRGLSLRRRPMTDESLISYFIQVANC